MKKILLLIAILGLTQVSCKKEKFVQAAIARDCTGTYLRIGGKDYRVCNLDMTDKFENGQPINVTFTKMKECNNVGTFPPVCDMYHPYEAWAEVFEIEKR